MAKGKKSSLAIAKERKRKLAEIRAKTEKETGLKVTPVSEIKAQIDAVSWVGKSTPTVKEAYEDGKTPADRNKRARAKKGKFKGDDKSTKRTNEAYKGGRKPKRRGRPKGSKNKKK